jgi:hypothetical protein
MPDKLTKPKSPLSQPVKVEEKLKPKQKLNKVSVSPVRVIITNMKNSSWVDDLDAHERLVVIQNIFH